MNIKQKFILILVCIVLGLIISMQFKLVQADYLNGLTPSSRSAQLVKDLSKLKDEKEVLINELIDLKARLKEIEDAASKESTIIKTLNQDINLYKMLAGLTDVYGEGIEVTIDNPPKDVNYGYDIDIVYDFELILGLVNELNAAGAEAISINGERLISSSEIRTAGNNINVNSEQIKPPFIIKAIGNKEVLDGAISQRFGIISILRDRKYQVHLKKLDRVDISSFAEKINFIYSKTVE